MLTARKAFVLAAGIGSRMGTLTVQTPKCLLPIQGKPMLGIWLDLCRAHGVEEILVNVHAHAEQVTAYLRTRSDLACRVSHEPRLLGSAGTLAANRDWVGTDEAFWVIYADVLSSIHLTRMAAEADAAALATLALFSCEDPRRCGIAELDEQHWITHFEEKPKHPRSDLAFAGILLARAPALEVLPQRTPADIGFDWLPQLVGRMRGYRMREYLLDIGSPERYQQAQWEWPGFQP